MKRQKKARDGQAVSSLTYFAQQMNSLVDGEESKHVANDPLLAKNDPQDKVVMDYQDVMMSSSLDHVPFAQPSEKSSARPKMTGSSAK